MRHSKDASNEAIDSIRWDEMLDQERLLRSAAAELGEHEDKAARAYALRTWWGQVVHVLQTQMKNPKLTPPIDLVLVLSNMAEYLHRGIVPGPVKDVSLPGRQLLGLEEERHIDIACAYIVAVKSGRLLGKRPIKTIANRFGVKRQTAQGWGKRALPERLMLLIAHEPRHIAKLASRAGKKYASAGRSSEAVKHRDNRQSK